MLGGFAILKGGGRGRVILRGYLGSATGGV